MTHPEAQRNVLTVAHKTLTKEVKTSRDTLIRMLEEGSRDYEVLQSLLNEYISLQYGADVVSGQAS